MLGLVMVKKYKFIMAKTVKKDYMVVEYTSFKTGRRKVLAHTTSQAVAKRKAIAFANKMQSPNIYIEVQIAGSIMK